MARKHGNAPRRETPGRGCNYQRTHADYNPQGQAARVCAALRALQDGDVVEARAILEAAVPGAFDTDVSGALDLALIQLEAGR